MSDRSLTRASGAAFVLIFASLYLMVSCGNAAPSEDGDVGAASPALTGAPAVDLPAGNPTTLSEWAQLDVSDGTLTVADGAVPYTLNSALFSDYAHKLRTISVPEGSEPAIYHDRDVFSFPVGTVITKTFYYPLAADRTDDPLRMAKTEPDTKAVVGALDLATTHLVETRVLAHRPDGWQALPYVWNDEQTDATLQRTGDLQQLTLVNEDDRVESNDAGESFVYVVPDVNQCSSCHATNHSTGRIQPIGPKVRHLNLDVDKGAGTESQLARWQSVGLLGNLPANPADLPQAAVWNDSAASLNDRARAYLDINCSHCHNENGAADTSALFLEPWTETGTSLGVCKQPIAAGTGTGGRLVGIDPGAPEDSVFVFRMESVDPGAMMPEIGRSLKHSEGVDLIAGWIASLDGGC